MKFKQLILNSIFWRGLYFFTVLLINILVSRVFEAAGTGWIYYITNYFSFILLIASLSLESGMTYYASQKSIPDSRLAGLSLLWSGVVSVLIVGVLYVWYKSPTDAHTREQFIFFTITYTTGILLTTFFCALFYARQEFAWPNILLSCTNILLAVLIGVTAYNSTSSATLETLLKCYFLNYLVQGLLIAFLFLRRYKLLTSIQLPTLSAFRLLLRYSLFALITNLVFFLLYRIDYWFIKKLCLSCSAADLGNYIQASKLGQMFLLLPTIIASTIFPRTAAGFRQQVNQWLPSLVKGILLLYLLVMAILVISGEWLFPFVYGPTFGEMYVPFLLLTPGILALSILSLFAAYNAGKDRVGLNLTGSVIGLVVIVAADLYCIPRYGIRGAAVVSSVGYLSYFMYLFIAFRREYGVSLRDFFIPCADDLRKLKQLFTSHETN